MICQEATHEHSAINWTQSKDKNKYIVVIYSHTPNKNLLTMVCLDLKSLYTWLSAYEHSE